MTMINNNGYSFDFDDQFDFEPKPRHTSALAVLSVLLSLCVTVAILYGKLF